MSDDLIKTEKYSKNQKLEYLLKQINDLLAQVNNKTPSKLIKHTFPIIFIVGCPRSGTTLLTQWLTSLNLFCYPTNFLSRFYKSPYLGALIQEMLYNPEYNYRNELGVSNSKDGFSSDFGKTRGGLAPHEFWYFWRLYFNFPEVPISLKSFGTTANFRGFQKEIQLIQNVFNKPFFIKALIINWYIELFFKHVDKPIFIYIKRDAVETARSILAARRKTFADETKWFSFKPAEYPILAKRNKYIQVAGQVYYTNRSISESIEKLDDSNKISVTYEDFCADPMSLYESLGERLERNGYKISIRYKGEVSFRNNVRAKTDENEVLRNAFKEIEVMVM